MGPTKLTSLTENHDATVDVIWCPPHNLRERQLQKIIAKYYKAFPNDPSEVFASAKDLILRALIDT